MPERFYTTAPKDYDWSWTTIIIDNYAETDKGKVVRLVEVEDAYHANLQVGRYQSGLHMAVNEEEFQKEVKYGFVKLTPDKAIYYFNKIINLQKAVSDYDKCKKIRKLSGKHADYTFEVYSFQGYDYQLTVFGPKDVAEQRFTALVAEIETILS